MIFTWFSSQIEQLSRLRGRLPHAILIHGPEGVGQQEFALELSRLLLCEAAGSEAAAACGRCSSCNWFERGHHPDFRLIQPASLAPETETGEEGAASAKKKKSDQILIDQVRDLQRFVSVGTHRAGLRVIVFHPAEAMNTAAQNALLKNLEEPPPDTLFLLVTCHADRLLPTILSRCQRQGIPVPPRGPAIEWLQGQGISNPADQLALAGGAPILAAMLSTIEPTRARLIEYLSTREFDLAAAADCCLKSDAATMISCIQRWAYDLLSVRLSGITRYYVAERESLGRIAQGCDPGRLATYLRRLAQARALAQHPLNPRLLFEDLLIEYQCLFEQT